MDKQNNLYVGGKFTSVGGVTTKSIAKYTANPGGGGSWSAIGGGGTSFAWDEGKTLLVHGNTLNIGGSFSSVGGSFDYAGEKGSAQFAL